MSEVHDPHGMPVYVLDYTAHKWLAIKMFSINLDSEDELRKKTYMIKTLQQQSAN